MIALSIRQPWAWLIIHAGKDVENRTWLTRFQGPCLIHASKGMTKQEYAEAFDLLDSIETSGKLVIPSYDELPRGGIVGRMQITGCLRAYNSPWFVGPWGFVIEAATSLPFYPCRGSIGFFNVPDYPHTTRITLPPTMPSTCAASPPSKFPTDEG